MDASSALSVAALSVSTLVGGSGFYFAVLRNRKDVKDSEYQRIEFLEGEVIRLNEDIQKIRLELVRTSQKAFEEEKLKTMAIVRLNQTEDENHRLHITIEDLQLKLRIQGVT